MMYLIIKIKVYGICIQFYSSMYMKYIYMGREAHDMSLTYANISLHILSRI